MRDEGKRYEHSTFPVEKVVASLHVVMFVMIVGIGVYSHVNSAAFLTAIAAASLELDHQ